GSSVALDSEASGTRPRTGTSELKSTELHPEWRGLPRGDAVMATLGRRRRIVLVVGRKRLKEPNASLGGEYNRKPPGGDYAHEDSDCRHDCCGRRPTRRCVFRQ